MQIGDSTVLPTDSEEWGYDEVVLVESRLAGGEYYSICTLDRWSPCSDKSNQQSYISDRTLIPAWLREAVPFGPKIARASRYECPDVPIGAESSCEERFSIADDVVTNAS